MEKITEDMVVDWLVSCDLEAKTWQIEELTRAKRLAGIENE